MSFFGDCRAIRYIPKNEFRGCHCYPYRNEAANLNKSVVFIGLKLRDNCIYFISKEEIMIFLALINSKNGI